MSITPALHEHVTGVSPLSDLKQLHMPCLSRPAPPAQHGSPTSQAAAALIEPTAGRR